MRASDFAETDQILARISASVDRGYALLEAKAPPEWRNRIDLARLNMSHAERCILGQVFGDYADGCGALGLSSAGTEESHGFNEPLGCWEDLKEAWVKRLSPEA